MNITRAFAESRRTVGTWLSRTRTVIAVAVAAAAAALFVAGSVQAQTIRTWDRGASTNDLNTAANWSGDTVPASTGNSAGTRQDALFDGTVAGTLNLTYSSAFGGSFGVGLVLGSGQTSPVNITNTAASQQNIRLINSTSPTVGGIQIASGAGALTIGAAGTANPVQLVLGTGTSPQSFNYYFNNSSANAATIEQNVSIIRGGSQIAALIFDGTGSWNVKGSINLLGASAPLGSLNVNGGANVTLSGSNSTFEGAININQGTLRIGNSGTTGLLSGSSAITGSTGATLAFNRTDNYGGTFGNTIGGGLGLTLSSGSLTLSGANTYSGTTTISGTGTRMIVSSAGGLGGTAAGTRVVGTGTVGNFMGLEVATGVTVTGEALELDGATGRATLFLNQNSGWAGNVTFANGTNYNAIQISGTGIQITGTINAPGSYGGGTNLGNLGVGLRGAGTATVSGPITAGSNTVEFGRDGSTWILTNSANTMGSASIWATGTLQIGGAGQLNNGSYAGTIVFNASSSRFNYGSSANQILSGTISGAGSVIQSGSGTLTLSANNTYAGTTTVSAGGLLINGAHSGSGLATVASGARIGGTGSLAGGLTTASGGLFVFNPLDPTLDVSGAVSLDNSFSVASLVNADGSAINWGSVPDSTYSLIGTTTSLFGNITNFGSGSAAPIGVGRTAYFTNTSGGGGLSLVIVPEPGALALAGLGIAAAAWSRRRRT